MDLDLNRPAWNPAALRFNDAIGHCSNYPLAFVYGLFMALSGHILGRRSYIRYATPLYPNSYICLVGPSALSHKSTALSLGLASLGDDLAGMFPLRSVTTRQGVLAALENNGGTGLIVLDELATLLFKKQEFASDLLSTIVELYGCPSNAGNYTRYKPISVENVFLTLVSGSTTEWLRTGLTATNLMAGFGNRVTFVLGDPRKAQAWPGTPLPFSWERLWHYGAVLRLSTDAQQIWDNYYAEFDATQHTMAPFLRVLRERIPEKVLKAAIVMAAWRNVDLIDDDLLERAIDWGAYLTESITRLAPAFEAEDKLVLAAIEGGAHSRKELFEALSHQMTAKRIREAIDNLRWLKYIECVNDKYLIAG